MQNARLTVNIEAEQLRALQTLSKDTGMSVSALTRSALYRLLSDRVILLPSTHSANQHSA